MNVWRKTKYLDTDEQNKLVSEINYANILSRATKHYNKVKVSF